MHHVRNARETGSAGGLVPDAYPGSDVGRGAGDGSEVELFGFVLGEFEQGGLQVGDLPSDRGWVQAVAIDEQL